MQEMQEMWVQSLCQEDPLEEEMMNGLFHMSFKITFFKNLCYLPASFEHNNCYVLLARKCFGIQTTFVVY